MKSVEIPMQSRSHINNTYFYTGVQDPHLVQASDANAHFAGVNHTIISNRTMQLEMTIVASRYPEWLHQYTQEGPYSPHPISV